MNCKCCGKELTKMNEFYWEEIHAFDFEEIEYQNGDKGIHVDINRGEPMEGYIMTLCCGDRASYDEFESTFGTIDWD